MIIAKEGKKALEQPHNVPIDGRPWGLRRDRTYMLAHDYTYQWEKRGIPYRINIKQGFIYDGASVPRIAWSVAGLRPDGLLRAAATIHDFLYEHKGKLPKGSFQEWDEEFNAWVEVKRVWTRKESDKMFGRLMREADVARHRRRMAYLAVRSPVGKYAWNT